MIDARNILTVGVDCSKLRGGVSAVEIEYSKFYIPWQHIATSTTGSSLKKYSYFIIGLLRFLFKMCTDRKIEIVHIHGASYSSFWRKRIIINIAVLFKKKVVFHCHGAEFKLFTSQHHKAVVKVLHKCDCIVCLSKSWKKWFENECGCKNVVIINNIIPPPQKGGQQKKSGSCFTMLFLGELGQRKGIFDLLDVISQMRSCDIKLLIGGKGDVDGVISRINELDICDYVEFHGWVSGDYKVKLFYDSDVFVLPSYNEGLPISVLEAMSYGLPIVSTYIGGIPEVITNGKNGFLIEPGDKKELYNALMELRNNPDIRLKMGRCSEKIALQHQPYAVESQLKEMYRSI